MSVNSLLDEIDDLLDTSRVVPLSNGKRIVDVEVLIECLEEIRRTLPEEVRQAKGIVNDRLQILGAAQTEADEVVAKAERRAQVIVGEQEIVKAATEEARSIIAKARADAKVLRQNVTQYCETMLKTAEQEMVDNAQSVRDVLKQLRSTTPENNQQ